MSSFIVSKVEYIKAAGLLYGIEKSKRDCHRWFVENVRERMEHIYDLNVLSVNEQYDEMEQPDPETYDDVFNEYARRGENIYYGFDEEMNMQKLAPRMMQFFSSVCYQIEDDACAQEAEAWFYICAKKLYEKSIRAVEGWWGEVEL